MNKLIILMGIGIVIWGYFNFYGDSFLPFALMIIALTTLIIVARSLVKGE